MVARHVSSCNGKLERQVRHSVRVCGHKSRRHPGNLPAEPVDESDLHDETT